MKNGSRRLLLIILLCLLLVALGMYSYRPPALRIAVVPGMQADFMREVQSVASEQGLQVELVMMQDYAGPNVKLSHGEVDGAAFQTQAYMEAECQDRGFDFVVLSRTILFPMGIYARDKEISLAAIPWQAVVQIPADAVNGSRALRLLAQVGLVQLRPGLGKYVSLEDVVGNPLQLQIIQRESTALPGYFSSTDLTVMGTTLAGALELVPCSDAIALEAPDSPYAQVVAVHEADSHRPEFLQLRAICQSEQLLRFVQEKTGGEALPAFVEK